MAKDESVRLLCFSVAVIQSMGAVKSRQQSGNSSWHQSMSAFNKRRKLGSSVHQEKSKDKDYHDPHHPVQFPLSRKVEVEAKSDHSFSLASTEQIEALQISSRQPSNKHSSVSVVAAEVMPLSQSSLCDRSVHSFEYTSDHFQMSQNKKREDVLYHHMNLDTHPAVTCLQNEQNLRLEGMEQRMNKIRKNAQQEAERRKFAHLFRARTEEKVKTERLLKEASVALQRFKKEKQTKRSSEERQLLGCEESDTQDSTASDLSGKQENDKGDIIPVRIVSENSSCYKMKQPDAQTEQPLMWLLQPVERFHLNGLVLWLVLPFLLPVLLVLHLIRHLSPSSDGQNSKKN